MPNNKKSKPSPGQVKLFDHLRDRYKNGKTTTVDEIAKATGWKQTSIRTYFGEGHLAPVLEVSGKTITAKPSVVQYDDDDLHKKISQSPKIRSQTGNLSNNLSKLLAKKSKENMQLALEIYNKPTVENRADTFAILYVVAWEQLLKAMIADRDGEDKIFTGNTFKGRRESIGITKCIELVFTSPSKSSVAKNLTAIKNIRDESVHLLCREIRGSISRLFQAGVLNYVEFYRRVVGEHFMEPESTGLIALTTDSKELEKSVFINKYGKELGSEIFALANDIDKSINEQNNIEYAIPFKYHLALTKKSNTADIHLTSGNNTDTQNVQVIEKFVSDYKKYKYLTKRAIQEINRRLIELFTKDELTKKGVKDHKGETRFTSGHFVKIADKEKWKNSNNQFHKYEDDTKIRRYSDNAIDFIVAKIQESDDYIKNL